MRDLQLVTESLKTIAKTSLTQHFVCEEYFIALVVCVRWLEQLL